MPWKKGESGNTKGRPKKNRALTTILERAGNAKVDVEGESVASKKRLAELLWQAATTGVVPIGQKRGLPLEPSEWLGIAKFIYQHIDGPPKGEMDVTSNGKDIASSNVIVVLPDNGRNDRD